MIKRNPHFSSLLPNYLFEEIGLRKKAYLERHPEKHLLDLGLGDTTLPLSPVVVRSIQEFAEKMGKKESYKGYGPTSGSVELKRGISERFYAGIVSAEEIFISDGAKCDIGRLQLLFGDDVTVALQDPVYPVYLDGSLLQGVAPQNIFRLPCTPENQFFPDLSLAKGVDVLYFCSPNNPTGAAATHEQLQELVSFAKKEGTLIIFDAAYSCFIQDINLPKSIFEIPGAEEVAIEVNSFSKFAGFTGVRLGWTVVPKELRYPGGESIYQDWIRATDIVFNGPSNLSEAAGKAVLSEEGFKACKEQVATYQKALHEFERLREIPSYTLFAGTNAPYAWIRVEGKSSWDLFDELLNECQIVSVPGAGFGSAGEGFVRLSAFAGVEVVRQACDALLDYASESIIQS